ncbi:MAG: exodeoxyribonuclease VII large subunit [Coriobacteriia bacterium]
MAEARPEAVSVSRAMALAKGALERVSARVVGEVTELADKPGYKAVYFTLGDESANMPCLVWRDAYEASGVALRLGSLVEVGGSFTAYAPKGRLQFQVRTLAPAGEGVLRLQVAALARRLEAEGLMREDRKRPLPAFPRRVGLVTSPRGKAVHDVIRTLRRRYPCAEVVVAGVPVEGPGAVSSIVAGLRRMAEEPGVDVVILARGGGSYEDLMPFNAEEVARAVAAMPMPVVTGIGHEPDTSVADMVADLRASTPTAAAEAVAPSLDEVAARLAGARARLARALEHVAQRARHRVQLLATRPLFQEAAVLLAPFGLSLDSGRESLERSLPGMVSARRDRTLRARGAMLRLGGHITERRAGRLAPAAAQLEALSPLAVLGRGYALCTDETGARVLTDAGATTVGERVKVRLRRGALGCRVETTEVEA